MLCESAVLVEHVRAAAVLRCELLRDCYVPSLVREQCQFDPDNSVHRRAPVASASTSLTCPGIDHTARITGRTGEALIITYQASAAERKSFIARPPLYFCCFQR